MDMNTAKKHGFTETKAVKNVTFNAVLCIQLTMPIDSPASSVKEHFKRKASEAIQAPVCSILREGEIFSDRDSLLQLGVKDGDVLQFEEDCQVSSEFIFPYDTGKSKQIPLKGSRLDQLHAVRPRVEQALQLENKSQDDSSLAFYQECEKIDDDRHLHVDVVRNTDIFSSLKPRCTTFTVYLQPKSAFITMTLKFRDGGIPRKCPLYVREKHTVGDVRRQIAKLVPCQSGGAIAIFSETTHQREKSSSPQRKDGVHDQISVSESSGSEAKEDKQLVDLPNQSSVSCHSHVFCKDGILHANVEPLMKLKVRITSDDQEGVDEVHVEAYRFDTGDDLIQLIANKMSLCPSQFDVYTDKNHTNPLVAEKSLNANGLHDGSLFYAVAHKNELRLEVHHVDGLFKTTITTKDPWNTTIRDILEMTEEKHHLESGSLCCEFDEEITLARLHFLKTHPLEVQSKTTSGISAAGAAKGTRKTTSISAKASMLAECQQNAGFPAKPPLECSDKHATFNTGTKRNKASTASQRVGHCRSDPYHNADTGTDLDTCHSTRNEVGNSGLPTPASLGPPQSPRVQATPVQDGDNSEPRSTVSDETCDSVMEGSRSEAPSPSLIAPAASHPVAPPPEPDQPPSILLQAPAPVPAPHDLTVASRPSLDLVPYNPAPGHRSDDIFATFPESREPQYFSANQHTALGHPGTSSFVISTVTTTCQQARVMLPSQFPTEQQLQTVNEIARTLTGGLTSPQHTSPVSATPRQIDLGSPSLAPATATPVLEEPPGVIKDKMLREIAERLGNDWASLCISLDVPADEISRIQHDHRLLHDQAFEGLRRWKKIKGREATPAALKKALQDKDLNFLALMIPEEAAIDQED